MKYSQTLLLLRSQICLIKFYIINYCNLRIYRNHSLFL